VRVEKLGGEGFSGIGSTVMNELLVGLDTLSLAPLSSIVSIEIVSRVWLLRAVIDLEIISLVLSVVCESLCLEKP